MTYKEVEIPEIHPPRKRGNLKWTRYPTIGYLHACRPGRTALVYDLMEPLRPQVDRLVLDFVQTHTFAPADVTLLPNGVCRLHPQLARTVAGLRVSEQTVQDAIAGAVAVLGRATAS